MADPTEVLDNPTGLGISGLDVPQETQPAIPEGQGGADDLVTEEDTSGSGQHNGPLEVLTDHVYAPEGKEDSQLTSDFSPSSDESDEDSDDKWAEEVDHEGVNTAGLEFQSSNNGLWQPNQEPHRAVLGFRGSSRIFRPGSRGYAVPYYQEGNTDGLEFKKLKDKFREKLGPAEVIRPSPLRTASSPDSPISPKNTEPMGDAGILPEPSPGMQDEDAVSPLSDRGSTTRPWTPAPGLWSEFDDDDTTWIEAATGIPAGFRRVSDPGNILEHASTEQPRTPVSPLDPVSEAEDSIDADDDNDADETSQYPEASEYDMQTSQQTGMAPESFAPVFVGAEERDDSNKQMSPTSPDFHGPEPLTGLTPQEGIDAWWAWRERTRPNFRTFRTNRNPGNQDRAGDLHPTTDDDDKSEAQKYLAAQRLDVLKLVNMEQTNIQVMARHSQQISEAIKFDLTSALEYVKLRMLKYRFERNRWYEESGKNYRTAGRRQQQIDTMDKEYLEAEQAFRQQIGELDAKLREAERAYKQIHAEKEMLEPTLQVEMDKRKRLKAKYQELAEMAIAYQRAAQSSSEELRRLRAKLDTLLSSTMEAPSQGPVPDTNEKPTSDTNDNPKSDSNQPAKQNKQAKPLRFSSIMEVFSQKPVSDTNDRSKPVKQAKRAAPLRLREFSSQENASDRSDNSESDANQHPKSAPPTYSSRRSPPSPLSPSYPPSSRPAPEHEANWPLAVRPPVVDFMTRWINDNCESRQPNDAPRPLQRAQLDKILGVGFLSWDQLIKELLRLGYTIRRDRLAQALADPDNVEEHHLPQPNTAVRCEARRLNKHNAVKELMDEVVELQRQLDDVRMPHEHYEDLRHMTALKEASEKENQAFNTELDKTWEEIERLRKALTDSTGIENFGTLADQEEIRRLKKANEDLQAELAETQQTLEQVLADPDSRAAPAASLPPPPPMANVLDNAFREQLTSCQERGVMLKFQNAKLEQDLGAARSDIKDFTQKPSDSQAKSADLEAKPAADYNDQAGDAKGDRTPVEALKKEVLELKKQLAACRSRGGKLQTRIEELEAQLETQSLQQQGNAGASSDLTDRLQAAEQHAKDLQEKVDELQLQLDEAKKKTPQFSKKSAEENAALQEALKEAEKKVLALQEQLKSHEKSLPTDELAQISPGPAGEDIATLRRQLAVTSEKNEKLGLDMYFLQNDLSVAQESLKVSREQVKLEPRKEEAPASERGSLSPLQGFENGYASLQIERARPASAAGSMADLEQFVLEQSDSESEETPKEDDDENDDKDVDEERAENLADANAWLQNDNKTAWERVQALEEKLFKMSQPSPTATRTETGTEIASQPAIRIPRPLPAARQPVPPPAEPPVTNETMSMSQISRRAKMYQSPTYIADAERRRVIRDRHSEEQQERVRLICRRAAAIFGEEYLPYVSVEKRYKPMARV
jgi:predicted  nucleic acid-binding Zn-ribbon protein